MLLLLLQEGGARARVESANLKKGDKFRQLKATEVGGSAAARAAELAVRASDSEPVEVEVEIVVEAEGNQKK